MVHYHLDPALDAAAEAEKLKAFLLDQKKQFNREGIAISGIRFIFGAEFSGDEDEHYGHKRADASFDVSVSEILRAAQRTKKPLAVFLNFMKEVAVRSGGDPE